MKPTLAAGVTLDFLHAAPKSAKLSTMIVCPLFFLCSLLTTVPRQREGKLDRRGQGVGGRGLSSAH